MKYKNRVLKKHKSYFDREATDFNAIERDPSQVNDPLRRFAYKYFLKLHEKNRRLEITLDLAQKYRAEWENANVLELGCGHGLYSIAFAKLGANATMVDYSEAMVRLALENAKAQGVEQKCNIICADLLEFICNDAFELVFLTGVTDYLPKACLNQLSDQIRRNAKELVIISFPKAIVCIQ